MSIAVNGDQDDVDVRLKAIELPADLKKHTVLGMQLADVTPQLKSAYDLYFDRGAVILDPGKDSDRLKIGRLAEGYNFWIVGEKRISGVREFVEQCSPRPPLKTPPKAQSAGFASFSASARSMAMGTIRNT